MKLAEDLIQGKRETLLLRQLTLLKIRCSNKGEEEGAIKRQPHPLFLQKSPSAFFQMVGYRRTSRPDI